MKMIFETPATVWQEAFPLGNGRIGALMFGDGEAETLCLNEDTLWSGYPGDPRTGMGYEDIKKAEVYAKEGKYLQAAQVLNQAQETAEDVEMYEPFGTVRIRFEGVRYSIPLQPPSFLRYYRRLPVHTKESSPAFLSQMHPASTLLKGLSRSRCRPRPLSDKYMPHKHRFQ